MRRKHDIPSLLRQKADPESSGFEDIHVKRIHVKGINN